MRVPCQGSDQTAFRVTEAMRMRRMSCTHGFYAIQPTHSATHSPHTVNTHAAHAATHAFQRLAFAE